MVFISMTGFKFRLKAEDQKKTLLTNERAGTSRYSNIKIIMKLKQAAGYCALKM